MDYTYVKDVASGFVATVMMTKEGQIRKGKFLTDQLLDEIGNFTAKEMFNKWPLTNSQCSKRDIQRMNKDYILIDHPGNDQVSYAGDLIALSDI